MIEILQAETKSDIEDARKIFREYEQWLGLSLCFQSFEEELASLPGKYKAPDGRLYLAHNGDDVIGCIALRELEDGICEMKRLFLREKARGKGVGNLMIQKLIAEAAAIGYTKMRLDTFPPKMKKAVELYESHGFHRIAPYYDNPHPETIFMELDLIRG